MFNWLLHHGHTWNGGWWHCASDIQMTDISISNHSPAPGSGASIRSHSLPSHTTLRSEVETSPTTQHFHLFRVMLCYTHFFRPSSAELVMGNLFNSYQRIMVIITNSLSTPLLYFKMQNGQLGISQIHPRCLPNLFVLSNLYHLTSWLTFERVISTSIHYLHNI